ncbi:MAG: endonuclease III domain-containing protein, partial [Bacillota bacterium]
MGRIDEILTELDKLFPSAECELNHTNSLELLIAVMLSAQTTDASVNRLTKSLFEKYKTVDDFADADLETLQNDIRRIGLYKNKAKNIKKTTIAL